MVSFGEQSEELLISPEAFSVYSNKQVKVEEAFHLATVLGVALAVCEGLCLEGKGCPESQYKSLFRGSLTIDLRNIVDRCNSELFTGGDLKRVEYKQVSAVEVPLLNSCAIPFSLPCSCVKHLSCYWVASVLFADGQFMQLEVSSSCNYP